MDPCVRAIIEEVGATTQSPKRRCKLNPLFCIGISFLLIAIASLGYIYQTWQIVSLGYERDRLQAELDELIMVNQHLRLQKAIASSPQRIEQLAKESIGMVEPPEPQRIVVDLPTKSPSAVEPSAPAESRGILTTISSLLGQLLSGDQPVQAGKIGH